MSFKKLTLCEIKDSVRCGEPIDKFVAEMLIDAVENMSKTLEDITKNSESVGMGTFSMCFRMIDQARDAYMKYGVK